MPDYSRLDAEKVHATIVRLQRRIKARFPERNLSRVAGEVAEVAWHVAEHQPPVWIGVLKWTCRTVIAVLALLVPGLILYAIAQGLGDRTHTDWIGIGESAINDLVFAGIAILFLWGLPDRIERARRFRILHRLRSLAHVVDMHQLTKDPDRFQRGFTETTESIDAHLDAAQLSKYLDYCSELLSLIAKTAALLADDTVDAQVLSSVQAIEDITSDLSRKIWQKIALLPRDARTLPPFLDPDARPTSSA